MDELKFQVSVPVVAELEITLPVTESIASRSLLLEINPVVVPDSTTETTVPVTVLAVSTSVTVSVAASLIPESVSVRFRVGESDPTREKYGLSLVPWMVKTALTDAVRGLEGSLSITRTGKVSVTDCPCTRAWVAAFESSRA